MRLALKRVVLKAGGPVHGELERVAVRAMGIDHARLPRDAP